MKQLDKKEIEKLLYALSERMIENGNYPTEILLVGGAALTFYPYARTSTLDVDYLQKTFGGLHACITDVADLYKLPRDWMNMAALMSRSFSYRLYEDVILVREYNDILKVYVPSEINLLCMKVKSGRDRDWADVEDIAKHINKSCSLEMIINRYYYLYNCDIETDALMFLRMYFN